MIRPLPYASGEDRRRARWLARRHWRLRFVPFAILHIDGFGRVLVLCQWLETRWSDRHKRRLWRVPV